MEMAVKTSQPREKPVAKEKTEAAKSRHGESISGDNAKSGMSGHRSNVKTTGSKKTVKRDTLGT